MSAGGLARRLALAAIAAFAAGLGVAQSGAAATLPPSPGGQAGGRPAAIAQRSRQADFQGETPSPAARQVADWAIASGDNAALPFIVVDKVNAKLFLFDPRGSIRATTPVLLGTARGDDSPPGIGNRKLSLIKPAERITPAGRFVAGRGPNLAGQDVLWVDYDAAISLHRATDLKPGLTSRDRLARLASASPLDNRISHGCINVSEDFYDRFIRSSFSGTAGIVYILPETRSLSEVFHLPGSNERAQLQVAKLGG